MTTIVSTPSALSRFTSAWTAAIRGCTLNGSKLPGKTSSGASSFVKPTIPTSLPPSLKTCDGDHSFGVLPLESTTLAERYGNLASGISSLRRYACPLSKLWLPSPSASKPIRFMNSIVGLSPKKAEIGLVAVHLEPLLQVGRAADREDRVAARRRQVVGGLRQRHELAVVVADVEDRGLLEAVGVLDQVVEDPPAGVLRAGDVHQERERRRDVDRAQVVDVLLLDQRPAYDEGRVHVDVVLQVDHVRQVAVLSEEAGRSDRQSGGRCVRL